MDVANSYNGPNFDMIFVSLALAYKLPSPNMHCVFKSRLTVCSGAFITGMRWFNKHAWRRIYHEYHHSLVSQVPYVSVPQEDCGRRWPKSCHDQRSPFMNIAFSAHTHFNLVTISRHKESELSCHFKQDEHVNIANSEAQRWKYGSSLFL